jgi:acetate kinase
MNKKTIQRLRGTPLIPTINGGSSSIKFALDQTGKALENIFNGSVDRIGLAGTNLTFSNSTGNQKGNLILESSSTGDLLLF